jgi:hypothetical protein
MLENNFRFYSFFLCFDLGSSFSSSLSSDDSSESLDSFLISSSSASKFWSVASFDASSEGISSEIGILSSSVKLNYYKKANF